jgi:hypothetical protein
MNKAEVVIITAVAACIYGIAHDQVTVRLCIEYFSVAHPPLFRTNSPTLLAICWGIAATLPIGTAMGVVLALVSKSGDAPPYPTSRAARGVGVLFCAMAVCAFLLGWLGYELAQRSVVVIPAAWADQIPLEKHHRFMAAWFAHGGSYLMGSVGGAFLCWRIWKRRGCPNVIAVIPQSRGGVLRVAVVLLLGALVLWMRFARS